MLITIYIANKYKIANHYTDINATYISSLSLSTLNTKKGIATDTFKFILETAVLDSLNETFTYLCYDTPVKLYIDNILIMDGYVSRLSTSSSNKAEIEIKSIASWQIQQFLSPAISSLCQNQVYSENCSLIASNFSYTFTTVEIDCLTGGITLDLTNATSIILGGNTSTTGNNLFKEKDYWWNAIIVINGVYKTNVVNVEDDKIYISLNYLDLTVTTESLIVYLKCDKTYGECYNRFKNTKNFWGFANTGNQVQTFDIFSASNLEFCGDDLQDQDFIECDTDYSFLGVDFK